jgi:hypothetical protein
VCGARFPDANLIGKWFGNYRVVAQIIKEGGKNDFERPSQTGYRP